MIAHQFALIKREFWEHRSVWVVPAVIALIVCLATLAGETILAGYDEAVDLAIAAASAASDFHRQGALTVALSTMMIPFAIGAGIVMIFYSLDSLYSERKDKSILFWRSLPITDAETVISKSLTLFLVIPAAALLGAFSAHLLSMVISSVWVFAEGGSPGHLIWSSAPVFDVWGASILVALAVTIWLSPFFGWFIFVSAYTRRMPLLMAILTPVIILFIEQFLPVSFFYRALEHRFTSMPAEGIALHFDFDDGKLTQLTESEVNNMINVDLSGFFASPSVWAGILVCGLFIAAAVYVRRYKDET
ncbi:MAG: hypothetical protein ACE5F8_09300 [Woeseiaceae bacterium]